MSDDAPTKFWTEERMARCRELWGEGCSAAHIGAQLGCTRNAVLSKIHRSGWSGRTKGAAPSSVPQRRQRAREATVLRPRARSDGAAPSAPLPLPPPSEASLASFAPGGTKTLLELRDRDCRWPIGDVGEPGFCFCAAPKLEGFSYCAAHQRAATDGARSHHHRRIVPWRENAKR